MYLYLAIDFYLVTELEMVLEKNRRANHIEILFEHPSPRMRPPSGKGQLHHVSVRPTHGLGRWYHCCALAKATVLCKCAHKVRPMLPLRHPTQDLDFGGETVPLSARHTSQITAHLQPSSKLQ